MHIANIILYNVVLLLIQNGTLFLKIKELTLLKNIPTRTGFTQLPPPVPPPPLRLPPPTQVRLAAASRAAPGWNQETTSRVTDVTCRGDRVWLSHFLHY